MNEVKCYDCGIPYGGLGWVEAVVPNDVWAKIAPVDGHGILCINCIALRCAVAGLNDVPVKLTAGPLVMFYTGRMQ